jgi:geranylgeranyl pyrophosphate synthase
VLDEGTERRGGTAARVLYGNSASILGGDHLLIEALRLVERFGDPAHLRALFGVIGEMIRAEAVQLERRGKIAALLAETSERRRAAYLDVARGKTAALFRWALAAGARASGLDAQAAEQAGRFGEALGIAFQLVDDVIDIEGDPEITGKNALADLREGKLTWPLLEALERSPSFHGALAGVEDLEPHRERVLAALRETDALRHTREAARASTPGSPPSAPCPSPPRATPSRRSRSRASTAPAEEHDDEHHHRDPRPPGQRRDVRPHRDPLRPPEPHREPGPRSALARAPGRRGRA